jgi:hypothetical protein
LLKYTVFTETPPSSGWRLKQYTPMKRRFNPTRLHGVITKKALVFRGNIYSKTKHGKQLKTGEIQKSKQSKKKVSATNNCLQTSELLQPALCVPSDQHSSWRECWYTEIAPLDSSSVTNSLPWQPAGKSASLRHWVRIGSESTC